MTDHQGQGCIDIEDRDERALSSSFTVLEDYKEARAAPGLYYVVSDSGREYLVDAEIGACQCDDYTYREPVGGCKHVRRVAFATGQRPIPREIPPAVIDPLLGEHVDGGPTYEEGR